MIVVYYDSHSSLCGQNTLFVKPGGKYNNGQVLKQSSTISSFVTAMKYDHMFRQKLTVVISIPDVLPVPNSLNVTHLKYPYQPCKNFELFPP